MTIGDHLLNAAFKRLLVIEKQFFHSFERLLSYNLSSSSAVTPLTPIQVEQYQLRCANYSENRLGLTVSGSSFLIIVIWGFSLSFKTVNKDSVGFGLLIGLTQKKRKRKMCS